MPDVPDWLLDLSGGALGLNKGAVLAADPFKAWDAVQRSGLENERFGVQNRDIAALQAAKERPDLQFYGNAATALDTANRLATSKGTSDIYGIDQTLLGTQYLASPQGQAELAALDPRDPEYRMKVAAIRARYSPELGIAEYDKFNIPGMQNQNTMDQFNEAYVQAYARRADPNAIAVRQPNGTFVIYGSQGETIPVNPDQLARIVSFMKTNDPEAVMRAGIKTAADVQEANARLVTSFAALRRASGTGEMTVAGETAALNRLSIDAGREIKRLDDLKKAVATNYLLDDDEKEREKERLDGEMKKIRDDYKSTKALLEARAHGRRGISPPMSNTGSVQTSTLGNTARLGSMAYQAATGQQPPMQGTSALTAPTGQAIDPRQPFGPAPSSSRAASTLGLMGDLYGQAADTFGGAPSAFGPENSALTAQVNQILSGA